MCDGDESGIKSVIKGQTREEEAVLHAGTSVFVLSPGDTPSKYARRMMVRICVCLFGEATERRKIFAKCVGIERGGV